MGVFGASEPPWRAIARLIIVIMGHRFIGQASLQAGNSCQSPHVQAGARHDNAQVGSGCQGLSISIQPSVQ